MSRDYRLPEFHPYSTLPHLTVQPPLGPTFHYPYPIQLPQLNNPPSTSSYEMTSASASASASSAADAACVRSLHPGSHFDTGAGDYEMVDLQCAAAAAAVAAAAAASDDGASRKRRRSCATSSVFSDYSNSSQATSCTNMSDRKLNHSEIEKRRRNRMNMYIMELSSMIPMCSAITRKLDKLSVLRMAVQHVRTVCGAQNVGPLPGFARPAFISEEDLSALLLRCATDSFLVVVGCARGRLHYVSQSVFSMLHYDKLELVGQSLFDILHPKDVAKVKEQLSSSDINPRERLIDSKTMLPVKAEMVVGAERMCSGARRSFFCRIKCKPQPEPESYLYPENATSKSRKTNDKKYCVVQCTGYLKLWTGAVTKNEGVSECDDEQIGCSCLVAVAVARRDPATVAPFAHSHPPTRIQQYVSRHAVDGKFVFVDQRVQLAVGFLPQELLGTSLYEHVSGPQLAAVARTHKLALKRKQPLRTPPYVFIRKDGSRAMIQTHFKPFRNPWTNEVDCLVANNTIVSQWSYEPTDADVANPSYENYAQSDADSEVQRLIDAQVESHRIGTTIAEETDRCPPIVHSQDQIFNACSTENHLEPGEGGGEELVEVVGAEDAPPTSPLALDGSGAATMAVLMSMLEADAGLGESINFNSAPWPLP